MKRILSAIIFVCAFGLSSPAGAEMPSLAPADAVKPADKDRSGMGCAPGQVLSYGEGGVYCAGEAQSQDGGIPNCAEGQVLTGSGGRLVCTAPAVGGGTLCGLALRRATTGYASLAKCGGQAIVIEPAPNSWPAPNCPTGYALQEFDVSGTGIVGMLTCTKN